MQLNVRIVALRAVARACGVRAETSLRMLWYVLKGQHQGSAFASKITFTPFTFVITITFIVLGFAVL